MHLSLYSLNSTIFYAFYMLTIYKLKIKNIFKKKSPVGLID